MWCVFVCWEAYTSVWFLACVWWLKTAVCLGPSELLHHISPSFPEILPGLIKSTPPPLPLSPQGLAKAAHRLNFPFNKPHPPLLLLLSASLFTQLCLLSSLVCALSWVLYSSHLLPAPLAFPLCHSFAVFFQCLRWPIYMGCPSLDPDTQAPPTSALKVRARLEITGWQYHPLKWRIITLRLLNRITGPWWCHYWGVGGCGGLS